MAACIHGSRRASASSSPIVWSACSPRQKSGTLLTTMPAAVAAAMSMRSVPAPSRAMVRQRGMRAISTAGT